ncbi:MAG: N-acetylmuramoyl-L-alanine amidase [Nitrospinota bacterium]
MRVRVRERLLLFALVLAPLAWSPSLSEGAPFVRGIRRWSTPLYTRIVIDLDGPARYSRGHLRRPERVFVDVHGARLSWEFGPRAVEVGDGLLRRVRVGYPTPGVVRVVLDLAVLGSYKVFSLENPFRIVVDVKGRGGGRGRRALSAPPSVWPFLPTPGPRRGSPTRPRVGVPRRDAPAEPEDPRQLSLSERFRRGLVTVVIDPGHGGRDPGAIGRYGVREKEVALNLARILRQELRPRFGRNRILLTREEDVFLTLEGRTAIANAREADFFLSIHLNASPRSAARGIETYLLSEASSRRALEVAARENGTTMDQLTDLQKILSDLVHRSKVDESTPLAQRIQDSLVGRLSRRYRGVRDLGVKRAPFYVLLGAQMPSVLVEAGFVTNPLEARRLRSRTYRREIARALAAGILRFIESPQLAEAERTGEFAYR